MLGLIRGRAPAPTLLKVSGGLGNQMFQYAAGRAASSTLGTGLAVDLSFYDGRQLGHEFASFRRNWRLGELNVRVDSVDRLPVAGKRSFVARAARGWHALSGLEPDSPITLHERDWEGWGALSRERQTILNGYWQSPKYFEGFESTLRSEFSLRSQDSVATIADRMGRLRESRSTLVGVHVRRGDVALSHESLSAKKRTGYRLLDRSYYLKAMERFDDCRFCFFSDDPEWCRSAFKGRDITVVSLGDELLDFFFLSGCDHQIASNSTFSWWAAWLNGNDQKTVVVPDAWYMPGFSLAADLSELIPSSWTSIPST
jgi:hypothetical protein